MNQPLTLADVELYCKPRQAERGLCVGGTDTGKSTLSEVLIESFLKRYSKARVLILDSKPRFRAQWELTGISAKRRYRKWDHGPTMAQSVALDTRQRGYGMEDAWKLGARIAIMHCDRVLDRPAALDCADKFYDASHSSHPQLLYVDEILDFFGRTGMVMRGAASDSILRSVRSGRERSLAFLGSTQRPRGLPLQLVSEASKLYCFRLDYSEDIEHLRNMGLPKQIEPPGVNRWFLYFDKRDKRTAYLKLNLSRAATAGV